MPADQIDFWFAMGSTDHVEWRFTDDDLAHLQQLAAEHVALRPDILVAGAFRMNRNNRSFA
jgi:hypothetical protein